MTPTPDAPLSPALTSTPHDITATTGLITPGSYYGLITHNARYIQTLRSKTRHVVNVHVTVMSSSYQILLSYLHRGELRSRRRTRTLLLFITNPPYVSITCTRNDRPSWLGSWGGGVGQVGPNSL